MIKTLCDYLDQNIERYFNHIALVDDSIKEDQRVYSYEDLYKNTYYIAHNIQALGISKRPIVIVMPSCAKTICLMYGTARSGSHYSIFMPDTSLTRLDNVLEELNPALVVSDLALDPLKEKYTKVKFVDSNYLFVKNKDFDSVKQEVDKNYRNIIDLDPMYVLYTSGSTGKAKGVVLPHRGPIDFVNWYTEEFNISDNDVLLNQCQLCFDASISDALTFVKAKATLHFVSNMLWLSPLKVLDYLKTQKITVLNSVPTVLSFLAKTNAIDNQELPNLRLVTFAGEKMSYSVANHWISAFSHIRLSNMYGPTEVTNICLFYNVSFDENKKEEAVPAGFSCNNMDVFLLSDENKIIPKDTPVVKGEVCARGTGIALGYFDNHEKTEAVFIQNPLHNHYLDRCYKTGDIGYYDEDGAIVILGRRDFQVKIAGHRVELGEIETKAESISGVNRAVCYFYNNKLYLVYEGTIENLKEKLKSKVEPYMLPNIVIKVLSMPVNQNSKIDRNKLLENLKNDRKIK